MRKFFDLIRPFVLAAICIFSLMFADIVNDAYRQEIPIIHMPVAKIKSIEPIFTQHFYYVWCVEYPPKEKHIKICYTAAIVKVTVTQ